MELFIVRNKNSHEVLDTFNNKMDAKRARDEKNGPPKEGEEPAWIVSPGRDHVGKHGGKTKKINRPTSAKYQPGERT